MNCLDAGDDLIYQIENNFASFGRPRTGHPVCHMTVGAIQGILRWESRSEAHQVVEHLCAAKGDLYCEFHVSKEEIITSKAN